MAFLSAGFAAAATLSLLFPGRWWLLAATFAILAIGAGISAFRRKTVASRRLVGGLAAFVGGTALVVVIAKVGLTLAAIGHIADLLG